jgi:hypothetical protein
MSEQGVSLEWFAGQMDAAHAKLSEGEQTRLENLLHQVRMALSKLSREGRDAFFLTVLFGIAKQYPFSSAADVMWVICLNNQRRQVARIGHKVAAGGSKGGNSTKAAHTDTAVKTREEHARIRKANPGLPQKTIINKTATSLQISTRTVHRHLKKSSDR